MGSLLQQSAEELAHLVGATVVSVKVEKESDEPEPFDAFADGAVAVEFKLTRPIDVDGDVCSHVTYQVWQDPEGNGPGYLALSGSRA